MAEPAGKKDFRGQDLRGRDFREADLRGACFDEARMGARPAVNAIVRVATAIIAGLVSALSALFLIVLAVTTFETPEERVFTAIGLGGAIASMVMFGHYGLTVKAMSRTGLILAIGGVGAVTGAANAQVAGSVIATFSYALVGSFACAGAAVVAGSGAAAFLGAVAGAVIAAGTFQAVVAVSALGMGGLLSAIALDIVFLAWVAWRVRKRDARFDLARSLGVWIGSLGGTDFTRANLTGASFSKARLRGARFNNAVLTCVDWRGAQGLDEARFNDPVLSAPHVRALLLSGDGKSRSYAGANLHGANLSGADLSHANLREANCTATDFTNAILTGACIQNWNIDHETRLEGVTCGYVFLLAEPDGKGSRKRRPADPERNFEDGEFRQLYERILQEIEILLKKGVTAEGAREAFRQTLEQHPGTQFRKFEDRGDSFVVGLSLPEGASEAAVDRTLTAAWEARLLEAENRHLLERARDLKEIALAAAAGGSRTFVNVGYIMNKQGSRDINIGRDLTISNSQVGSVTGDVDGLLQQLGQSVSSPQAGELHSILKQLLESLNSAAEISGEQKADAAEQITAIVKAAESPAEPAMQKAARLGFGFLKGLAGRLPEVAQLIEAGQKLFEALQKAGPV